MERRIVRNWLQLAVAVGLIAFATLTRAVAPSSLDTTRDLRRNAVRGPGVAPGAPQRFPCLGEDR